MTAQDRQPNEYNVTERIFNVIDDLSADMQFDLFQHLIEDKVSIQLFKLIIDMSDDEKVQLLEKLGELPFEEEPIKTINLDENESFMREDHRKNCLVAVKGKVGKTSFSGVIVNISVHGVFIEGSNQFSVGQQIRLAFKLPNATKAIEIKGKINRSGSRGIGVYFLELSQDQQDIIRAYIANSRLS